MPVMALWRAVDCCGGIDALGDALNADAGSLQKWMHGEEPVPIPVFMQAVGLILEASATRPPKGTPDSNDGGRRGNRH